MNAKFRSIAAGLAAMFLLSACGGGGGGDDNPVPTPPPASSIDPTDVDAVMEAIEVKIGGLEGVFTPNQPIPAQTAQDPKVESVQAQTPASNGSTAQVPIVVDTSSALEALFLKLPGADGLITVDLQSGGAKAALVEQKAAFAANGDAKAAETFNVEVTLPPNIEEGEFEFDVAVKAGGQVSNTGRGKIVIARVGTGKLQFSLSWDAEVDLDLHVTEPNGNQIYYGNPGPSASTGELDIDDLNGPADSGRPDGEPEGVENIFWVDSAPIGTYVVRVDYYSGQQATNFVVTVSADGQVLDTISSANFQQGCVRVYTLDYIGNASSQGTPSVTPDPSGACGG